METRQFALHMFLSEESLGNWRLQKYAGAKVRPPGKAAFSDGQRRCASAGFASLTRDIIRSALRLAPDADTAQAFDELGIDSWDLIELRAILESRFRLHFSDAEWVSMKCLDDILRAARLTE